MAAVAVIAKHLAEGMRQALVLTEDRLGHYPEFRDFFVRTFDLDRIGSPSPASSARLRAPRTHWCSWVEAASPFRRGSRCTRSSKRWSRWTTQRSTKTCGRSWAGWSAAWERRGRWRTFTRPAGCIAFPRRDDLIRHNDWEDATWNSLTRHGARSVRSGNRTAPLANSFPPEAPWKRPCVAQGTLCRVPGSSEHRQPPSWRHRPASTGARRHRATRRSTDQRRDIHLGRPSRRRGGDRHGKRHRAVNPPRRPLL